jgi:hypothetical protein
MHRLRVVLIGFTTLAISGAFGVWAAASNPSDARTYGAWAPGVVAKVTAMSHGELAMSQDGLQSTAPADLVNRVRQVAAVTGGSEFAATASLRKLQSGLGVSKATLYAFSPGQGAVCLVVWKWSTTCPTAETSPTPGVVSIMNGGYPAGTNGAVVDVPSSFAGLVADNVKTVTFVNNGDVVRLAIRNNTFFHVPAEPGMGTPWLMELRISYNDGSTAVLSLPDPRPA